MSYQKTTGPLMANSHPGSYCGQDAHNDMFVTERKNELLHRQRTSTSEDDKDGRGLELYARSANHFEGGQDMEKVVRRLTEKECERLQGFPDNWTLIGEPDENGDHWYTDTTGKRKKVSSSARYKALGNSIALPFWQYLARRICAQYEMDITMASLFDGIGGFPYVFERCGAKAVWASEIEEFPIAVTKEHFPE